MEIIVTRDWDSCGQIDFWNKNSTVRHSMIRGGQWSGTLNLAFNINKDLCKFLLGEIPRKGSKTVWILEE